MENGNGVNLKVAVLTEKVNNIDEKLDRIEDSLLHKLRNNESQLKFIYDDISDIQNKLKYMAGGAVAMYAITQGGAIEFLKAMM